MILTRCLFATWVEFPSFIFLVSYSWSSFPGLTYLVLSPFIFQILDFKFQVSYFILFGSWLLGFGSWHWAFASWYLQPGTLNFNSTYTNSLQLNSTELQLNSRGRGQIVLCVWGVVVVVSYMMSFSSSEPIWLER